MTWVHARSTHTCACPCAASGFLTIDPALVVRAWGSQSTTFPPFSFGCNTPYLPAVYCNTSTWNISRDVISFISLCTSHRRLVQFLWFCLLKTNFHTTNFISALAMDSLPFTEWRRPTGPMGYLNYPPEIMNQIYRELFVDDSHILLFLFPMEPFSRTVILKKTISNRSVEPDDLY